MELKQGISVVVCTYNGSSRLSATLKSIAQQQVSNEIKWELLIVDNASTDDTSFFVQNIFSSTLYSFKWRLIYEPLPGLNYARVCGLKNAMFDSVLFCDDDNILDPDYVQMAHETMLKNPNIGVLGGHGIPLFEGAKPQWWDRYSHSYAVGAQANTDGKIQQIPAEVYGAGAVIRRLPLLNLFEKGFLTIMTDRKKGSLVSGGDVEWCYLLQLLGFEIWYSSKLRFNHIMPTNRLEWSYYLKLKEGIASGAGLLSSYDFIFKKKHGGLLGFVFFYCLKLTQSVILLLNFRLKHAFNRYNSETADLGRICVSAKSKSFQLNFKRAIDHYLLLKKVIN